jgi:hypothetical protein
MGCAKWGCGCTDLVISALAVVIFMPAISQFDVVGTQAARRPKQRNQVNELAPRRYLEPRKGLVHSTPNVKVCVNKGNRGNLY